MKDKLIKIGAKVKSHRRHIIFHSAEVAIPTTKAFQEILRLSAGLRGQPHQRKRETFDSRIY